MADESNYTFRSDMDVKLIDIMGSDARVSSAARISTSSAIPSEDMYSTPEDIEKDAGLINFLMKNRHGSPFEHCFMTFVISAPIVVAREFVRHRMASYNEESGRYTELKPVFYVPAITRKLVQTGKAGQYSFTDGTNTQHARVVNSLTRSSVSAYEEYKLMLNTGIAREVARMCLPVNIYTSWYSTMNLRGLMNFLSLRVISDQATFPSFPQREIEMVAEQMETEFELQFPLVHAAFCNNGRVAP